jgi:glutaconate CoA-transferase, subunit B
VAIDEIRAMTGWIVRVSSNLEITPPPTPEELTVLRDLEQRTAAAHGVTPV